MTDTSQRTQPPFDVTEAALLLGRTPLLLDAWLRGLPDHWVHVDEGGDTWSAFAVLGHLIHGEQTDWVPRVRQIMTSGDEHPFEPFDRLAQFRATRGRSLAELLDEFAALRRENLAALAALQLVETDLDRRGRHPAFGAVTLRQLLATWVAHDCDHVAQIARVIAHQYSDAVGPWRAYLRVISGQPG